jgi:hypothetical protein
MNRAAAGYGYKTRYTLHVLPDADHDFDELVDAGLARELFVCLFDGRPSPTSAQL